VLGGGFGSALAWLRQRLRRLRGVGLALAGVAHHVGGERVDLAREGVEAGGVGPSGPGNATGGAAEPRRQAFRLSAAE
jgi:hypothetical protein